MNRQGDGVSKTSLLSIWFAMALLASTGCSLGLMGERSGTKVESDSRQIAALKEQIVELQRHAAMSDVEIARLQRRLADLESGTGARSVDDGARADSSARGVDLEPLRESADRSASPSQGFSGLEVSDLPVVSAAAGDAAEGRAEGASENTAGPKADGALTAAAQALYDRGYTLFHRGQYVDSETAFQRFLSGHSETVLGDNAQFWIAQARYARGDVDGALAAYRETVSRFPGGNKVPDAQLKIGDCLSELGDTEAARLSYRAVIEDFPSAAAATTARERLAQSP